MQIALLSLLLSRRFNSSIACVWSIVVLSGIMPGRRLQTPPLEKEGSGGVAHRLLPLHHHTNQEFQNAVQIPHDLIIGKSNDMNTRFFEFRRSLCVSSGTFANEMIFTIDFNH